jgi:hypothetical protein
MKSREAIKQILEAEEERQLKAGPPYNRYCLKCMSRPYGKRWHWDCEWVYLPIGMSWEEYLRLVGQTTQGGK